MKDQPCKVNKLITGRDLRKIRLSARLPTTILAKEIGLKSRKTINNWEEGRSEPNINQFITFCTTAGLSPGHVIAAIQSRNSQDPSQKRDFIIGKCVVKTF